MTVIFIFSCQTGMQMWSSVMTIHLVSGCYPDFAFLRDKYFALVSFWNISLRVGLQWTGHASAWLSLAGSKHNLTFPLGLVPTQNCCTILVSHLSCK